MLRRCRARVGWFEGNPFQSRLWELAEGTCPRRFARFVVPGAPDLIDGELSNAFGQAVALSKKMHFRSTEPVDTMLFRVLAPKDANFYQASRAATYVALVEHPAIHEGGTIYLEAACPEGIGAGVGGLGVVVSIELLGETGECHRVHIPRAGPRSDELVVHCRQSVRVACDFDEFHQ